VCAPCPAPLQSVAEAPEDEEQPTAVLNVHAVAGTEHAFLHTVGAWALCCCRRLLSKKEKCTAGMSLEGAE